MSRWQINPEQITRTLAEMVRIDSVNPSLVPGAAGEGRMAEWLSRACESLGLEVRTQETAEGRPNVIARWPGRGGGRSLLLTGHTDIVGTEGMTIEPFEPRIEDGRMYGRGTMDMKGGLAAILGAVAALRAGGFEPAGDLLLGFVTDEEYVSIGSEALVKTVRADAAILTEPTGLEIVIAHRGYAWLSLETRGRAAHGSLYDVGIDAIAHMGRVLNTLERMEQEVLPRRKHPLLGRPSVHTSAIEGGLSWAIYPDRCTLKIEHRTLPGETGEDVLALWENALAELSSADPTFSATARLEFFRPAYEIERDEPIAAVLGEAFRAATRKEPVYSGMRAWLDSAILGPAGIPTVIFGPGGEGMHAAVEYVYLEDVFRCAAVLAGAAALWTGTAT